ncbi:MFS transporter [Candidatus Dojkabacteria bacterium]|nr:MFS transporter [Candidatus Dojkabacteria bacterium]
MESSTRKSMDRNVKLYIWIQPLLGLLFTIPVWVAFQQRFLSYTGMALMESSSFLITMIFELPSGVLADLIGRRKTIIIGWAMVFIGYIVEGFSFNLGLMLIGYFLVATGAAFVSGADEAIFYDSLKALGRESEFSALNARGLLLYRSSMILAMFTGGYFYSIYFGLPYIFRGLGVLAATILAFYMIEPYIDTQKFSFKGYYDKLKSGVTELLKSKYTKALSVYYVLMAGVSWSCLYYFNNPLANDVGYTPIQQSYVFAGIYVVTTTALAIIVSKKRILEKKFVFIAFPIILMLGLLPGIFANKILVIPMLALVIIAGGARFAILNSYTNEEISSSNRATSLSALSLLVSIFCALIISILGVVQDRYGTQLVFTILGLIILFIGIPATVLVVNKLRERDLS